MDSSDDLLIKIKKMVLHQFQLLLKHSQQTVKNYLFLVRILYKDLI